MARVDMAAQRLNSPDERAQQGRLTGAIWPQQADAIAAQQFQVSDTHQHLRLISCLKRRIPHYKLLRRENHLAAANHLVDDLKPKLIPPDLGPLAGKSGRSQPILRS